MPNARDHCGTASVFVCLCLTMLPFMLFEAAGKHLPPDSHLLLLTSHPNLYVHTSLKSFFCIFIILFAPFFV